MPQMPFAHLSLVPLSQPSSGDDTSMQRPGPGWFDSSWELRSGLEIREGWPADATIGEWVEGWLQPAAAGGASLSAM